jgi:hypothetical protein
LLFFLPLSNYLSKFLKNNLSRFLIIIGFISLVIFNSKNLLRIKNEISDQRELYSFKNFPFFNIRKPEYKMILLNDNSKAYLVINDMCWATPSPCLHGEVKKKTINNYSIFYRE